MSLEQVYDTFGRLMQRTDRPYAECGRRLLDVVELLLQRPNADIFRFNTGMMTLLVGKQGFMGSIGVSWSFQTRVYIIEIYRHDGSPSPEIPIPDINEVVVKVVEYLDQLPPIG